MINNLKIGLKFLITLNKIIILPNGLSTLVIHGKVINSDNLSTQFGSVTVSNKDIVSAINTNKYQYTPVQILRKGNIYSMYVYSADQ